MPKIRNIIIFITIGAIFVLIYIFFIKASPSDAPALVSSGGTPAVSDTSNTSNTVAGDTNKIATQDFLNLLLSVKNIKLDDAIFSDDAFINVSKHDSGIILVPDGNEGRVNPFAQFGNDIVVIIPPICTSVQFLNTTTNTCVARATCALPQILNTTTNTCVNPPTR